ncbi:hypothetical protein [Solimonas soli]|uniref:hypothetical protein n=1 Tax=Solimonas soli TaxID=413479 RepID=UPI0012F8E142|nr:hypothetical protein [Solimonas soli]
MTARCRGPESALNEAVTASERALNALVRAEKAGIMPILVGAYAEDFAKQNPLKDLFITRELKS